MTAKLIDGKLAAEQIRNAIAIEVEKRVKAGKSRPGLATVLIGENPASVASAVDDARKDPYPAESELFNDYYVEGGVS